MTTGKKRTVAFHTLGCKLNFSESSEIGRQLEEEGYKRVPFGQPADISVVHTCSVTGAADRKTRQAIRKAKQISPGGITVAMGCYAQLKSNDLAETEGVDLVLGTTEKFNLPGYLEEFGEKQAPIVRACNIMETDRFFAAQSEGERTRAFLKVQDGCDYTCSYCTIPKARGKSRNPSISSVVTRIESLVARGIPEIVLTGVNTGDFGRSTGENFFDLLKALDQIQGHFRFRISSIEPNLITPEIIDFIADSAHFTPHFHIPLQSGSDAILKKMSRRYLRKTFADRVNYIYKKIPDASIGADVIVGFPSESEENFLDAMSFIESLPLSYLHVFTYSERPGTPAADIKPVVSNRVRDERSARLHELGERKRKQFYESQTGKEKWLIPEGRKKSGLSGFTENYIETLVLSKTVPTEPFVRVRVLEQNNHGQMLAEIINQ